MGDNTLEAEYHELTSELRAVSEASGETFSGALFNAYAELAAENGDCPDLTPCEVVQEGRGGYRVDGSAFDRERGILLVAICDPRDGEELETLNAAQLDTLSARARRFVEHIMQPSVIDMIVAGSPEDIAGGAIAIQPVLLKRVQILIFSNARLSTRKPPELLGEIAGRPVVSNVLDFVRFAAIARSKGSVEPIEIDLSALANGPVPCLPAAGSLMRGSNDRSG